MAQKVTVELQDDLDGGPADETVRFGFDGSDYEIDLSKKNAARFRSQLEPYLDHARKAGRGQRRRSARTPSSRQHSGTVRAWAREQGITVSERGRIPANVIDQYEIAVGGA
jgi:Lsr2